MAVRAAEYATVVAIASLVTLALAAPVLRAPSERIFGMEAVGRHHDPFTMMWQFTRPIAWGAQLQPLTDVPGALLARAWGPVVAYNALVLLTFPLSAAAAYGLARHIGLSPPAGALAACAFAFSPFHIAHAAYHPHIAQVQWVALYLLALWRCLDRATPGRIVALVAAVTGVALSNFYGGLIALVIAPVSVTAYWLVACRRAAGSVRHLALTVATLAGVSCAGLAYTWWVARAVVTDPAGFGFPRDALLAHSARWWSYLVPPLAHPVLGDVSRALWNAAEVEIGLLEQQVSVGWALPALALVAVLRWRGRASSRHFLTLVPVLVAVAGIAFVCSLAPVLDAGAFTVPGPSAWLHSLLPMFRAYARFGVVVQLMLVLLASVGAESLWRSGRRLARIGCGGLVALAAAEALVAPSALWRDVLPTTAHRWVVGLDEARVKVLDCAPRTRDSESVAWLTGGRVFVRADRFDDCGEPNLAGKLAGAGFTHLLVRRKTSEGRQFARHVPPDGLRRVAHLVDGSVFAVTAREPLVYTVGMADFFAREYGPHATWRWMSPDASWTIANTSNATVRAAVDLELTAFAGPRRVEVRLDGRPVQTLVVEGMRQWKRVGPIAVPPGHHELQFHLLDAPTQVDSVLGNGDMRRLGVAIGAWRWLAPERE